jgi:hypothetical protein
MGIIKGRGQLGVRLPGNRECVIKKRCRPDVNRNLLFRVRNNGCVAAVQQRGRYIHYDKKVAFLIDGCIEN